MLGRFLMGYFGFFAMLFGAFLIASGLIGAEVSYLIAPTSGIKPAGLLLLGFLFNFFGSYAFYVSWRTVQVMED